MHFIYSLREKLELFGLLYFAILFLIFFPPSLSCKERARKKSPHMPPACVCPVSFLCATQSLSSVPPSLSSQCLSAYPVAPDQESGDPFPIPLHLRRERTRALAMSLLMLLKGQAKAVCMGWAAALPVPLGYPGVGMVAFPPLETG